MNTARQETERLLSTIDPETGDPPESVLRDAASLRSLWDNYRLADETGSYNRSLVRQLINGHPPFDQGERDEEGTGDLFNINTGNGRLIVDEATSGFMDMFSSERNLVEIPLDPRVEGHSSIQKMIEDEFSKMLHSWDSFTPRVNNLCHTFATDGVAVLFFEDDDTWQVSSCGLKDVKFPRSSEPVSSKVPVAILRKSIHVGTLWRHIRNPEAAEKKGWDLEAVRSAIVAAADRKKDQWPDWESVEQDLKSNELFVSGECNPVEVLYGFIEEYDGTVSMCMGAADSESKVENFLYKRPKRYKNANEIYQIFPYSTGGEENSLYSIRGIGYFIYQMCNAENIMFCKLMDAARIGSSLIYQPRGNEALEDGAFMDLGHGMMMPPGVDIAERAQAPNLTQSLIPALQTAREHLDRLSGGLQEGATEMGERANEATVGHVLEQINKMNAFAVTLFYPPLDRIYKEKVRRVFFENKDTPESLEMKERLNRLGVTEEHWSRIDLTRVRARRILMGASKTGRVMKLRQVRGALIGEMDEQGRKESAYDIAGEELGKEYAQRYFGNPSETRTTHDDWIARLEVNDLAEGSELEALDGQNHIAHLRVKVEALLSTKEGIEEGTLPLEEYVLRNLPLWNNANQHLAMLVVDPSLEQEAARLKEALQQLGELFTNGMRAIRAQERKAQEEAVAQNGANEPQEERDLELMAVLAEKERKDFESQADIARKDNESAAKIARDAAAEDLKAAKALRSGERGS